MELTRILIVENQIALRQLLTRQFTMMIPGGRVTSVADGLTALDLLQAQPFDLVVVDCHLKGIKGSEMAQAAGHLRPSIRIVLLTRNRREEMQIERAVRSESGRLISVNRAFMLTQFLEAESRNMDDRYTIWRPPIIETMFNLPISTMNEKRSFPGMCQPQLRSN